MKKIIFILILILTLSTAKLAFSEDKIDLSIKDLIFSKEIIFENEKFDILINLCISGIENLKNFNSQFIVSIFWDKPSRFTHIDSKVIEKIEKDCIDVKFSIDLSAKTFSSSYLPPSGDRTLVVQIDSGHQIKEVNEENNIVEKKFHIFKLTSKVIKIFINNKIGYLNDKEIELEIPPMIIKGRTMVPLRFVVESFGGEVVWNNDDKSIKIKFEDKEILMWLNNNISYINDKKYALDVPPTVINGRTIVPIRFVAEALNSYVFWDSKEQKVTIIYEK
ncbi:MAG: copper amine oxidase N-terminal domain-containing protein [Caldisericia bacterium]|nr:copper amine oxidase N-terminal domain-containing protein [Caldisericia bacterium]